MKKDVVIFAGGANASLAKKVSGITGIPLESTNLKVFSNGESFVQIEKSMRGKSAYIIQSTCVSKREDCSKTKDFLKNYNDYRSVNDNLMELFIIIDALIRGSVKTVNCVIPYFGYARSDKKDQSGVPITAKLVANMLTVAGVSRVITMDLHSGQIQGFFDVPVDHLYSTDLISKEIKKKLKVEAVVSPDSGAMKLARYMANKLDNCSIAVADKRREGNNDKSNLMHIIGNVKEKNILLYDDIIDTGGSLINVACALKKKGAKSISAACIHGVLSGEAVEKLEKSPIEKLFITDSIPLIPEKRSKKIEVISIAELLASAIIRIQNNITLRDLF